MHAVIRKDLHGILPEAVEVSESVTILQIHASLAATEQQLFGKTSTFETDLPGCCLYTEYLESQLTRPSSSCVLN